MTLDARTRQLIGEDIAALTASLDEFARLRGKRLLLTGASGFIGTWLLETIAHLNASWAQPCHVYALTRDPAALTRRLPWLAARPELTLLPGDIRTFAYPDAACDFIIHAAAPASPRLKATDPVEVGEIIVAGTRHVLDIARNHQAERVLFLSSGAVYGRQPVELARVPEEYTGGPDISNSLSTYGEAKRYAEVLCVARAERQGLPVTIARPFTAIGANMDLGAGYASTDFLRDAVAGQPLRILSDGTTLRSYCTAADYVRALWGILFRGVPGRAYNVGSDEAISVLELAQRVATCFDRPMEIQVAREPVPGHLPERYVPDITRLSTELDLRPRQPMERGLRQAIAWASHVLAGAPVLGPDTRN